MNSKITKTTTLGEIATQNINYVTILYQYNLDFYCDGLKRLEDACSERGINTNCVLEELNHLDIRYTPSALHFKDWSMELLIQYVLKFHHSYIREEGPKILNLLTSVCQTYGDENPNLIQIKQLFTLSLEDLENHLMKEEQVLFPFIDEILSAYYRHAPLPQFHCGSIENPISVMESEHTGEGDRFREIARLTNEYKAPQNANDDYKNVMLRLKEFEQNLHLHIHVENNIIFPRAIELQTSCMQN